jgi:FkbM family methyltransferase
MPDKPVRFQVRGVELEINRRHWLRHFTRGNPLYAENMVSLGRLLSEAEGRLCMLDVGANIGDSALLVLEHVDGEVVCVEPDPEWVTYLRRNVGSLDNVAIEPSVLVGPEEAGMEMRIVHHPEGTSQVRASDDGSGVRTLTTDELLANHPQLQNVRLVKTDTDGYDVQLVPPLARTFIGSKPILFFEFDPLPTALAAPDLDPNDIWQVLIDLGYERAVVWDNGGRLIGPAATAELPEKSKVLELTQKERGYGFWDVAVAHRDDPVGLEVLEAVAV